MRLITFLALAATTAAGPAIAQDSVTHASLAAAGASEVVGHLAASGFEAVTGVIALPTAVVGSASVAVGASAQGVGGAFSEAGVELVGAAEDMVEVTWGPLSVDDRIIVRPDPAPQLPFAPEGAAGR